MSAARKSIATTEPGGTGLNWKKALPKFGRAFLCLWHGSFSYRPWIVL